MRILHVVDRRQLLNGGHRVELDLGQLGRLGSTLTADVDSLHVCIHLLASVVARIEVKPLEPRAHGLAKQPFLLLDVLMQAKLLDDFQSSSVILLFIRILDAFLRR